MTKKISCAILGSGSIGTDHMFKPQRSDVLEPTAMVGNDPASGGLKRALPKGR